MRKNDSSAELPNDDNRRIQAISHRYYSHYYTRPDELLHGLRSLEDQEESLMDEIVARHSGLPAESSENVRMMLESGEWQGALSHTAVNTPEVLTRLERLNAIRRSLLASTHSGQLQLTPAPNRDFSRIATGELRAPYPFQYDRQELRPDNDTLDQHSYLNHTNIREGLIGSSCLLSSVPRSITGSYAYLQDCAVITNKHTLAQPSRIHVRFSLKPQYGMAISHVYDGQRGIDMRLFVAASHIPFVNIHHSPLASPVNETWTLAYPGLHTIVWQRLNLRRGWVNKSDIIEEKPWNFDPISFDATSSVINPDQVPGGLCVSVGVRHQVLARVANMKFFVHSVGTWIVDSISVEQF